MFQKGLLAGKKILITGGGTGLGKSIGRRYAELGAELVICGRRQEVIEATAAEMAKEFGSKVTAVPSDVRDPESVEAMLERIWADGPLDVLVNNAAGNFIAQTHKLSARAIDSILGIVLHGAAYCTVGCGRRWIEAGRPATVLNILTLSALTGAPFTVPSAMAKAGVVAMIKSLAVEWGPKGIRLVGVAPGPFPTEGAWSRLRPEGANRNPPEKAIPLGRVGRHEELADLCAYLVSDKAGFITGEVIAIDGGKQHTGGGGVGTTEMLAWTDADWDKIRPAKKNS